MKLFNFITGVAHRAYVSKRNQAKIKSLYKQIARDIKSSIAELKGKENVGSIMKIQQLKSIQKQIEIALNNVDKDLENLIVTGMTYTAQGVVKDAQNLLNKAGLKIKGAYANVPEDIVTRVVSGKVYQRGWSLSKAIWQDSRKIQNEINTIIAKGIAENSSAYDIAKDLEKYVNPSARKPWDWSKVYPGCRKKIDYNAQRLSRTLVNHAYQQSLIQTCKGNPYVRGIKWLSDGGERTCDICRERNGKIYPVGDVPLDHPNGLCTQAAVLVEDMQKVTDELVKSAESPLNTPEYQAYKAWRDSL